MKLFKVFVLYGTCMLVLLPQFFCNVKTLATEATNNMNDIDFYNKSLSSIAGSVSHFRGKRFIAFPVGSSFSAAVCMTTGVIGNPNFQFLSMGLNWGIAYELPNSSWVLQHTNGFGTKDSDSVLEAKIKRRHRRDLYGKLETLINGMGYNGRDCVLRALCESRQYFQNTKIGMIGEMLRVVFSLPKQRIFRRELEENPDIALYDKAYRKARSLDLDCATQYECSFSLLELAFGKYSTPPAGYYEQH